MKILANRRQPTEDIAYVDRHLQDVFVCLSENRRFGASDHQKKKKKQVLLDPILTAG